MNDRNVQAYDSQELEDGEGSGLILSKDPTTADHKQAKSKTHQCEFAGGSSDFQLL